MLKPIDYVRRIHDEDLDDDGDMIQLSSGNGEISGDNLKRRKVSEEPLGNPTDSLTKATLLDSSTNKEENPGGSGAAGNPKLIFKSSAVRISVRKPASNDSNLVKMEGNKQGARTNTSALQAVTTGDNNPARHGDNSQELKIADTSAGLQSLCQNYESDDD